MRIQIEVKTDSEAAVALAELMQNLDSLAEDMPWRDEIDDAMENAVTIANNMVVIVNGKVAGRLGRNNE